ncbi:MAG TPA: DUF881 domain-containing protein, partial [Pilimelia sp.]|nr:DUF881 domain-containing protein [Pilimelia sp.]
PDFLTALFRFPLDPGYADAAAARARGGPRPPGRRRAVRALCALVACLIGVLFAVAYRKTLDEEPGRERARTGLVDQIDDLRTGTDDMQHRADALRARVARLREVQPADPGAALRATEAAAALTRVRGDGIVVTVADPAPSRPGGPRRDAVVAYDLRQLVNALWAAGATAVQVNNIRLSAVSNFRDVNQSILVNTHPITSPYRVRAIGGPRLPAAYHATTGAAVLRSLSQRDRIVYAVREVDDLYLAAAPQPPLRHARPVRPPPSANRAPRSPSPAPAGGR